MVEVARRLALRRRHARRSDALQLWHTHAAGLGCRRRVGVLAAAHRRRRRLREALQWLLWCGRAAEAHSTLPLRAASFDRYRLFSRAVRAWLLQLLCEAGVQALAAELRHRLRSQRLPRSLRSWRLAAVDGRDRGLRKRKAMQHFAERILARAVRAWRARTNAKCTTKQRRLAAFRAFAAAARVEALHLLAQEHDRRSRQREAVALRAWPAVVHNALSYLLAWRAAAHASKLQARFAGGGGGVSAAAASFAVDSFHRKAQTRVAQVEGFFIGLQKRMTSDATGASHASKVTATSHNGHF